MSVTILAVGDVVGDSGLEFFKRKLNGLKTLYGISFTVVNGENASGTGLTPSQADAMLTAGADVVTLGNHTFAKQKILPYLDSCRRILRPANYAPGNPGRGWGVFPASFGPVCVINLIGRCEMNFSAENPFLEADRILKQTDAHVVLVDMHAEATSEKQALGYYLDGRVTAVWGTHTHVQTSDARVLSRGTGFLTDVGMSGPEESVLGIRPEQSVSMFLGQPPQRFEVAPGPCKLECVLFDVDEQTGRCLSAEAVRITE